MFILMRFNLAAPHKTNENAPECLFPALFLLYRKILQQLLEFCNVSTEAST